MKTYLSILHKLNITFLFEPDIQQRCSHSTAINMLFKLCMQCDLTVIFGIHLKNVQKLCLFERLLVTKCLKDSILNKVICNVSTKKLVHPFSLVYL